MKDKKDLKDIKSIWENFWYYYKYHVLAALFAALMIGMFIKDKISQIHYDYRVAVLTEQAMGEEVLTTLQESFEAVALDLEKDGKVQIEIMNYVTSKGEAMNPQLEMANQTKLIGDLEAGDSMIFLYSDEIYEVYKSEGIFDVEEGNKIKLSQCKANKEEKLDSLNISMRVVKGTPLEKKKDKMAYYKESESLLERFVKGE